MKSRGRVSFSIGHLGREGQRRRRRRRRPRPSVRVRRAALFLLLCAPKSQPSSSPIAVPAPFDRQTDPRLTCAARPETQVMCESAIKQTVFKTAALSHCFLRVLLPGYRRSSGRGPSASHRRPRSSSRPARSTSPSLPPRRSFLPQTPLAGPPFLPPAAMADNNRAPL